MEFIKAHYEKILLGLVLLGLTIAVGLLPFIIKDKKAKLDEIRKPLVNPVVKPLDEVSKLDMKSLDEASNRARSTVKLDFTSGHNLLNPVLWQMAGGNPRKITNANDIGPGAIVISAANPISLKVIYDSPSGNGYMVFVSREAAEPRPAQDRTNTQIASLEPRPNSLFTLKNVNGPADKPSNLELVYKPTGESLTVGPDRPFTRIDGYSIDLSYPPDPNQRFLSNRREGDTFNLEGETYKIDSIANGTVVIISPKTGKRWTRPFNPAR